MVLAIVLSVYGGYSIIYNISHGKDPAVLGVVFFIAGMALLLLFFVLLFVSVFQKKKNATK